MHAGREGASILQPGANDGIDLGNVTRGRSTQHYIGIECPAMEAARPATVCIVDEIKIYSRIAYDTRNEVQPKSSTLKTDIATSRGVREVVLFSKLDRHPFSFIDAHFKTLPGLRYAVERPRFARNGGGQ